MFRLRRYRLVLIFTFVLCLVVYHFSLLDGPDAYFGHHEAQSNKLQHDFEPVQHEFDHNAHSKVTDLPKPPLEADHTKPPSQLKPVSASVSVKRPLTPIKTPIAPIETTPTKTTAEINDTDDPLIGVDEKPKLEATKPKPPAKVHWRKESEHFPVPTELVTKLPKIKSSTIKKVQATFAKESESKRSQRLERRAAVKEAFEHSWKGYRDYAWGHDELAPLSKSSREKFGGWGASLVDALDTMWIMGLKKEFEEALGFVEKLDFTYSTESRIPVFETTIRYLGGLLGAYDVSEHKYPVLLQKATELGDVLFGVFDTPNRMPILYYYWKPDQVAIPQQAASKSGLAEMGTLALEFTRLAQLTGNNSYFDAIQRITDQLEAIQYDTSMPGMWPTALDASGGCIPPPGPIGQTKKHTRRFVRPPGVSIKDDEVKVLDLQDNKNSKETSTEKQLEDSHATVPPPSSTPWTPHTPPACTPSPIRTIPYSWDEYTLGAASDSFYEYLIKMHILLEGSTQQYGKLYESSMKVAKNLFYRPMLPKDPDILISGTINVRPAANNAQSRQTDTGHLACFTGGMLALGAQALGLKEDLEIGRKLTDGCVLLYNIMPSGVMPEYLDLVPCKDAKKCSWDEEEWLQALLPGVNLHPEPEEPTPVQDGSSKKEGAGGDDEDEPEEETVGEEPPKNIGQELQRDDKEKETGLGADVTSPEAQFQHIKRSAQRGSPSKDWRHDGMTPIEKAWRKVKNERLPPGVTSIRDSRYILRPEAIESVYIMYRITGDTAWQDKGWNMFQSTVEIARTDIAFVEISDVTRNSQEKKFIQTDSMESFWLAETLKYYYLLFSEPELISLDEWVFNTEAHPFRRGGK